jgi:hypothetical protein
VNPLPLPLLSELLLRPRREAWAAFATLGWLPWTDPPSVDAERRRLLNIDLSEPDLAWPSSGAPHAVARLETDFDGLVTLVEVVAAEPLHAARLAAALLGTEPGEPRLAGGAAAREWVWGPESGSTASVGAEPVRIWCCAEQAYGDRLWVTASLVRRPSDQDDDA